MSKPPPTLVGEGGKMLQININTSEGIVSKVYDQDGLGQNIVGKVHKLPLSYRLDQYKRIAVWVTNLKTLKSNFHYVASNQGCNNLATINGQVEAFTGVADISIDNFLIRGLKEPRNYKKFPVKGSQQMPLDVIKTTLR